MKILVTGAAGYIGSTLIPMLLVQGHEVTAVDAFMFGNHNVLFQWISHPRLNIIKQDVRRTIVMDRLYKEADIIIPLAAIVGAPACDRWPEAAVETNRDTIIHMMKQLSSDQKVIFPNTNSGYGSGGEAECFETSPLKPISLYGITKCDAEDAVLSNPNSVVLRLATVCGVSPRMRFDLMFNDFVSKIKNLNGPFEIFEPHFKRNFVHVKDVCKAFIWMLYRSDERVLNVGNPMMNMTKLELAHKICDYYDTPTSCVVVGLGKDPDQRNYLVNNDRLLRTGFEFEYFTSYVLNELDLLCNILSPSEMLQMRNV